MSSLNISKQSLLVALLGVSALMVTACGGNSEPEDGVRNQPDVDQRLTRIEELLQDEQADELMNTDSQIQQLESDIRQLRGRLEEQEHRIEALNQELKQVKQSQKSLEPEPYQ